MCDNNCVDCVFWNFDTGCDGPSNYELMSSDDTKSVLGSDEALISSILGGKRYVQ